jgi:hypothetical protein
VSENNKRRSSILIPYSIYTRSAHNSNDLAIGNLSDEFQQLRFVLQSRLDALRLKFNSVNDDIVS